MSEQAKCPHEQAMAGYEVACKYGVLEARGFSLADEMYAVMFRTERQVIADLVDAVTLLAELHDAMGLPRGAARKKVDAAIAKVPA